jgi:hypothetical protein
VSCVYVYTIRITGVRRLQSRLEPWSNTVAQELAVSRQRRHDPVRHYVAHRLRESRRGIRITKRGKRRAAWWHLGRRDAVSPARSGLLWPRCVTYSEPTTTGARSPVTAATVASGRLHGGRPNIGDTMLRQPPPGHAPTVGARRGRSAEQLLSWSQHIMPPTSTWPSVPALGSTPTRSCRRPAASGCSTT